MARKIFQDRPQQAPQEPSPIVTAGPDIERAKAMALAHRQNINKALPTGYDNLSGPGYVVQNLAEVFTQNAKRDAAKNKALELEKAYKGMGLTDEEAKVAAGGDKITLQSIMQRRQAQANFDREREYQDERDKAAHKRALEIVDRRGKYKQARNPQIVKTDNPDGTESVWRIIRNADGTVSRVPVGDPGTGQPVAPAAASGVPAGLNVPGGAAPGDISPARDLAGDSTRPVLMDPPPGVSAKEFMKKQGAAYSKWLSTRPEERMKMYSGLSSVKEAATITNGFIDEAIGILDKQESRPGTLASLEPTWATGWAGRFLEMTGMEAGTSRADFVKTIDAITNASAFEKLMQMREESKTGGAVGQLTDKEREALGSIRTGLHPDMSDALLKKRLVQLKDLMGQVQARREQYFESAIGMSHEEFGKRLGGSPAQDKRAAPVQRKIGGRTYTVEVE